MPRGDQHVGPAAAARHECAGGREGAGKPVRAVQRDARWRRTARQARLLSWLSLGYMAAEGGVAIVAAVRASSVALLGFGLDSAIEGLASVIVVWRMGGRPWGRPTRRGSKAT